MGIDMCFNEKYYRIVQVYDLIVTMYSNITFIVKNKLKYLCYVLLNNYTTMKHF